MLLIADNIQLARPSLAGALAARNPAPLQELALRLERKGVSALDVNFGPLGKDGREKAAFALAAIREVTALPLCLDTPDPLVMEAALKAAGKGAIVNGASLEPKKLESMPALAREYGADLICFLLRSDGHVASGEGERLSVAVELVNAVEKAGVPQNRLILDPLAVPLIWGDGLAQAREVASCVALLPDVLGFAPRRMVGLSNLASGGGPKDKRLFIERIWLAMLVQAGLDTVLYDAFNEETARAARAARLLASGGVFAWEAIGRP